MQWIIENLPQTLLALGILILIMDAALFGFSTFVFTFLGGSMMLSGIAMWLGILPATTFTALWSNALFTAILAATLWKPLLRLQNKQATTDIDNDFAQIEFKLEQPVDRQGLSTYQYSGIRWKLKSEQPIAQGTLVQVVKSEVGVLWVIPKE